MPANQTRWLVVTDLDGTLLDDDYDLDAAARALDRQAALGRTVAVASSKTLDEMLDLARRCQVAPVLIFENGAGLAWPAAGSASDSGRYRVDVYGEGYPALRRTLRSLRRGGGYRFAGFGDLSAREVSRLTRLSLDGARLARHRRCTEPVVWLDEPDRLEAFRADLAAAGYRLLQGGRFHHVMPDTDKSHGLRQVAGTLVARTGGRVRVVACGDADNDLAMLRAADRALVFPRRDGSYLEVRDFAGTDVAVRVERPGAASWSRALDRACRQRCNSAAEVTS